MPFLFFEFGQFKINVGRLFEDRDRVGRQKVTLVEYW
jgi:hypothetical protein